MKNRVSISADTLRAYSETSYRVGSDGTSFVLRVGERSEAIHTLHSSVGVNSSVFVTACNPFGAQCSDEANAHAMGRLVAHLRQLGLPWLDGEGQCDDGSWPAEPSVLALGVSEVGAQELCAAFEQNAVLVITDDAVPRLLFHPDAIMEYDDGGEKSFGK